MKTAALILTLVVSLKANFLAYMPLCAVKELKTPIEYTLANFGHILYGQTVVGELVVPEETEFCSSGNTQTFMQFGDNSIKKFVLVKRGGCKFTKKILNAEKRGADMVIIYDNQKTTRPDVVMANDGHGHLINIPSIFISNSAGQKILSTKQKCSDSLIFKMTFDVFVSKTANLTFWLDVSNRESFTTIRDFFRDYYSVIKKYLNLELMFKLRQDCGKEDCDSEDCILQKKQYCIAEKKTLKGDTIEGKQITNEHLRSYFLFQEMKQKNKIQKWVQYMNAFDDMVCIEQLDLKTCSYQIMKDYTKTDMIEAKLTTAYQNLTMQLQNPFDLFVEEAFNSDIIFYPEASINGRNFYGLFRAPDIFQMICESLESPPSQCHTFMKSDRTKTFGPDDSVGLWKTVLIILGVMLLIFLGALFVYTKLIKRQINQQMSVEVNRMVEHYVAMTEEKSRSSVM